MNNNKICFITCVNDERAYEECIYYIKQLNVPEGFDVEAIGIRDAYCMAAAYNKAMNETDAKYKVYLHQDALIINKNFIQDFLNVFNRDENIGMLGLAGSKIIPTNAIWWESNQKYGKIYDSHTGVMKEILFNEVEDVFEEVKCIDGVVMITQYDVNWRDEIFDGWHFYDLSQSTEFIKAGYKVVIPNQIMPWCIHDSGVADTSNGYNLYRNIFLDEYSKEIFPLVSVLIPTYNNTVFLEEALISAINQTYRNIEIIVGDDSTDDRVEVLIEKYKNMYSNIKYINNNGPLGGRGKKNIENLIKEASGYYISYLLHDDVYYNNKIEVMINQFLHDENISLVTSSRNFIDENGQKIGEYSICNGNNIKVDRMKAIEIISKNMSNFIGELSTAIFKLDNIEDSLLDLYDIEIGALGDISLWIKLLGKGDLLYINEVLSGFRQHMDQNTYNLDLIMMSVIDWYHILEFINLRYGIDCAFDKWYEYAIDVSEKINDWDCIIENDMFKEIIESYKVKDL